MQRKVYRSEAHFQEVMALEVRRRLPNATASLERFIDAKGETLRVDLSVEMPGSGLAVELKYKTKELRVEDEGELYQIKSHLAPDQGRYDFIKDVCRLESIAAKHSSWEGYAILLTNDSAYWRPPISKRPTNDADFRLHEDRLLCGDLLWGENASPGTKSNGRDKPLQLRGVYWLRWSDYASPSGGRNGQFRYLAVHVSKVG
jgi:hypothetical protein